MNPVLLSIMSGPLAAMLRYAATAFGTVLVTRGYLDASAADAVVGGIIAVIPAVIGTLTSTVRARVASAVQVGSVESVKLANGTTLNTPEQALRTSQLG